MILFREQHEDANVIHLIMGQETEFQLNMSGNLVVDLTSNLDSNKRNILYINKCDSEEELQDQIEYYQSKQLKVTDDKQKIPKNVGIHTSSTKKPLVENSTKEKSKFGTYSKDVKCPKCLSWGAYVKDGLILVCDVCRKIDEGLATKDVPLPPLKEDRKGIVENFFKRKQDTKDG